MRLIQRSRVWKRKFPSPVGRPGPECVVLISANESYQRAEEDLEELTGIKISHSTLQ